MSRKIQVSYKTALFMMNRLRLAMATDLEPDPKLSGTVEMDETYCGGKPRKKLRRDAAIKKGHWGRGTPKTPVLAVVQRGGEVRTKVVANVTADNIQSVLEANVEKGSRIMTDEFPAYKRVAREHGQHERVRHYLGEYVNYDDPTIHTNTIEGFFSRVKRQLNGTYHAVSKVHLHRYISQAAWLYNSRGLSDGERAQNLIDRLEGKRMKYRAG